MTIVDHTTLYFREGNSDKVYQANIIQNDDGFVVTFAYGRRGSALKDGSKTPVPVPYEQARKIYDKLVAEKTAKSYTPGKDGTPFSGSSTKERSGISCQLLNPIEENEVMRLCHDPAFAAQEKIDGERRLLEKTPEHVRGINRNSLYVAVTEPVMQAALALAERQFVADGELVGDVLHIFDLLENTGGSVRELPYRDRLSLLQQLLGQQEVRDTLVVVPTAYTTAEKLALVERTRSRGGEGVVFKKLNEGYTAGRPNSGGSTLKFKFYETCSAIVARVNEAKRSVGLALHGDDGIVAVGNVTIPPNHMIPNVGDVVEVRYLYAFRGGALFQPVYLGKRGDIESVDCTVAQLKYKQDAAA